MLGKYLRGQLDNIMLVCNHANNHTSQDKIGLASMCVRLSQLAIGKSVITIVKFGNVSPKVLLDGELATGVNLLVP